METVIRNEAVVVSVAGSAYVDILILSLNNLFKYLFK